MAKSRSILVVLLCCITDVQPIRGIDFGLPAISDTLYIMQTLPFEEGEKGDKCIWDFSNVKDSVLCPIIIERTDTTSVNIVCRSVYTPDWIKPETISPVGQPATTYQWDDIYLSAITIGNQTNTYTYIPYVGVSSITTHGVLQ